MSHKNMKCFTCVSNCPPFLSNSTSLSEIINLLLWTTQPPSRTSTEQLKKPLQISVNKPHPSEQLRLLKLHPEQLNSNLLFTPRAYLKQVLGLMLNGDDDDDVGNEYFI